ncbi:hypothetical protein [Bacillus sp. Marseille-Q1617]|uniref:hypothetical protein n=1 Tax=Bacillus sp. Marseille-Q1617 TaxID=2736887 RepID=UPI00158AE5A4|nr:hypothetical protein [Bacillus sp. Marseille-Q1617]
MSKYIIENADCASQDAIRRISLLVEDNRISAIRESFSYYNHIRLDVSPFIMTPSHVMCDMDLPVNHDFPSFKAYLLNHFIAKGCTTFLTCFRIEYEFEFREKLEERRTSLLSSPLDYTIGLAAPANLIRPDIIRQCKRNKVPVVWILLDDMNAFSKIKWGWIKGLLYDYRITFVPFFTTNLDKKEKIKHLKIWQKTMKSENIPHFLEEIHQKVPLPIDQLKKIGIYPHRGNFLSGGELSYNLYMRNDDQPVSDGSSFHYESHVLKCTMNRGKYHYLNDQGYFYPGAGKELCIQTPGFFT